MGQLKHITAKAQVPGSAGKDGPPKRPHDGAILFMTDRRRNLTDKVPGQPAPDILPHIEGLLAKLPRAIGKEVPSS